MHTTIDNCPLCHDTRVVRLHGKNYPCPECVTMVHADALHTIRYMQRIRARIDSLHPIPNPLIKASLLHGLALQFMNSDAVVFRDAPADTHTGDRIAEASVCVVSAEARLKIEQRQDQYLVHSAQGKWSFALAALLKALRAVRSEAYRDEHGFRPCQTTLSLLEHEFNASVSEMYETESNAKARRADELREQYAEQTQDHP